MDSLELNHILRCHPIMKTDIIQGENTSLYDSSGRKILDFEAGTWCTALGHCHPRVNRVMTDQINNIIHLNHKLTSTVADTLAINLLEILGFGDGKALFLSSGSEAVELMVRLARLISSRKKLLAFSNSYLSAFSGACFPRSKELWSEVDFLSCRDCKREECSGECIFLNHINFSSISAFVFEPAMCGRVIFPPYKLVKFLEKKVREYGGLIAANEVTTGFGRTGKWSGYNHYDLEPDMVALGKALGNGYPISGVVMKKTVADEVEGKNFAYVQSHQNDPLGCVTAKEVLNILREDNLIERSSCVGEFFMEHLKEIKEVCPIVKEVRGKGLMLAIELKADKVVEGIAEKMLDKGFFIGVVPQFNTIRFSPALTIAEEDIARMCSELKVLLSRL